MRGYVGERSDIALWMRPHPGEPGAPIRGKAVPAKTGEPDGHTASLTPEPPLRAATDAFACSRRRRSRDWEQAGR